MYEVKNLVSFFKEKGEVSLNRIQVYLFLADLYRCKWRGEKFLDIDWVWNGVQFFSSEIEEAFSQKGDASQLPETLQVLFRNIYTESLGSTLKEIVEHANEICPIQISILEIGDHVCLDTASYGVE